MNKKNVNFIADAIHSLTEGMKELTEDSDRAFHNLTEGLKELTEKVEELKNSIDDGGVFKPEDGEEYWIISDTGGTFDSQWVDWVDTRTDEGRYAIGNCFSTRKSAEDAVRVLKLIQKARESQDGYVPDWKDKTQSKYHFYFESGEIHILTIHFTVDVAPIFGYWEDESVCEQFIRENSDELIWFFTEYKR